MRPSNATMIRTWPSSCVWRGRRPWAWPRPAACRTRDGKLWFPTIKGLVSVNPAALKPNTNPPAVVIESVLIGDQLQDIFKTRNERTAFVNADPDLLYRDVVEVIDVAKGAGVDKIGLMTEQIQAGK